MTELHQPNKRVVRALSIAVALVLVSCGGGGKGSQAGGADVARGVGGTAIRTGGGETINLTAHNLWKEGVAAFQAAEKAGWNDQRCESVADKFENAAEAQNKFAEALYMAGVVHSRCG